MLPDGWKEVKLGDVCTLINGRGFKPHEWSAKGLPIIRIQNLNGSDEFNYYDGDFDPKILVKDGQLLFAWSGSRGTSFGPHVWHGPDAVLNYHTWKVQVSDKVDKTYFLQYLRLVTNRIEDSAHGAAALVHTQKGEMEKFKIVLPSVEEQKALGKTLGQWDMAITELKQLLAEKQKQKKALMQRLLTGKHRFHEFEGQEWQEVELGNVFERVRRKNDEHNTNVVTISGKQGFVLQSDYFKKNIASSTLDGYFLLHKGEFAYNKSYSNGYPMGAIKRLNILDKGVVTTLYICFALKDEKKSCANFFEQFFESGSMVRGLSKIANEGGRAHGLLNVTPSDFFKLKMKIPTYAEQQKIAAVLNEADKEIDLLMQKLEAYQDQKNGLMQQLLTGKKRVKLDRQEAA